MGGHFTSAVQAGHLVFGPTFVPGNAVHGGKLVYFEDWITGSGEPGHKSTFTADQSDWFRTTSSSGSGKAALDIEDGQPNGVIKFTTGDTATDLENHQMNGTSFMSGVGGELHFEMRCKFTNATQDAFFGLSLNTVDAHGTPTDDMIGFALSGDADLERISTKNNTVSAFSDTGFNIVADTWYVFSFTINRNTTATWYVDGIQVDEELTAANVPDDAAMSPVLALESNGANESMFVDYILIVCDRPKGNLP